MVLDGQPALTASDSVPVPLDPGQAVRWTLSMPGRADVKQQARCLPADFPTWQVTRAGTPASQWYVLSPTAGAGAPALGNPLYVVVADDHGTPVWWTSVTSYRPIDAKLIPGGGGLMFAESGIFFALSTTYHEVGWDGATLGSIGAGANIDMHDLIPAQGGGWYAIRYVPRDCVGTGNDCADMTAYGGSTTATIIDGEIVKLDGTGSVVWSWNARDHLAFSEWSDLASAAHTAMAHLDINGHDYWDINHLNSVEDDGDGVIISSRHLDAVYRINTSDGSVDWKAGWERDGGEPGRSRRGPRPLPQLPARRAPPAERPPHGLRQRHREPASPPRPRAGRRSGCSHRDRGSLGRGLAGRALPVLRRRAGRRVRRFRHRVGWHRPVHRDRRRRVPGAIRRPRLICLQLPGGAGGAGGGASHDPAGGHGRDVPPKRWRVGRPSYRRGPSPLSDCDGRCRRLPADRTQRPGDHDQRYLQVTVDRDATAVRRRGVAALNVRAAARDHGQCPRTCRASLCTRPVYPVAPGGPGCRARWPPRAPGGRRMRCRSWRRPS